MVVVIQGLLIAKRFEKNGNYTKGYANKEAHHSSGETQYMQKIATAETELMVT